MPHPRISSALDFGLQLKLAWEIVTDRMYTWHTTTKPKPLACQVSTSHCRRTQKVSQRSATFQPSKIWKSIMPFEPILDPGKMYPPRYTILGVWNTSRVRHCVNEEGYEWRQHICIKLCSGSDKDLVKVSPVLDFKHENGTS